MKIECILRRAGGTPVTLGSTNYLFKPSDNDPNGPHFAEVTDEKHIALFERIPEGYRNLSGTKKAAPGSVTESDDEISFNVPLPLTADSVASVLETLGAAYDPAALHGLWPDLFPALNLDEVIPQLVPSIPAPAITGEIVPPIPAIALGAAPQPDASQPAPSITLTATAAPTEQQKPGTDDGAGPGEANDQDEDEEQDEEGASDADDTASLSDAEKRLAALTDSELRDEFERVIGRRPHGKARRDTMIAQLVEHSNEA